MISKISISNFGPIKEIKDFKLGKINLIIGRNGAGKTFLLKSIYVAQKCLEQYRRGKEPRTLNELLVDKLYWTFQSGDLGNLVNKDATKLEFLMTSTDKHKIQYSFGNSTKRTINRIESDFPAIDSNSIYFPAKEILSIQDIIIDSRSDKYNDYGFDDTYYDLANALKPTTKGRNIGTFANIRKTLNTTLSGCIKFDPEKKEWYFLDNKNRKFVVGVLSEGVKKISILDALFGNHYLSQNSIIFIDEPESALHPELISQFMDIIYTLSQIGIQFVIASHSYFVIKKLTLIAQKHKLSIPVISADKDEQSDDNYATWNVGNLKMGLPDNPIICESIKLYEEEIFL